MRLLCIFFSPLGMLVAGQIQTQAVPSCTNLNAYVGWIQRFEGRCTFPSVTQDDYAWFQSCDWITCECLWASLSCPVPDNEIYACFEQGMKMNYIEKRTQAFVLALLQTCRGKTQHLSQPCGECDKYKSLRSQCAMSSNKNNSTGNGGVRVLEFKDNNPYNVEIPRTERAVESSSVRRIGRIPFIFSLQLVFNFFTSWFRGGGQKVSQVHDIHDKRWCWLTLLNDIVRMKVDKIILAIVCVLGTIWTWFMIDVVYGNPVFL